MYDVLYSSKNYEQECDRLETAFRAAPRKVHSVLDFGCGTGNHAVPLARRGYRVLGLDRSRQMLEHARHKAAAARVGQAVFEVGDLRTVRLNRSFDACLLMFAVLGYQTTNYDVADALENVRRHLEPGGLVAFDVWHGPAVLIVGPSERVRVVPDGDRRLVRHSSGTLDVRRHVCHVRIHQMLIAADRIVAEVEEHHAIRYFFPLELELFLDHAGFDVVEMTSFDAPASPLDATTWNMFVVARRR